MFALPDTLTDSYLPSFFFLKKVKNILTLLFGGFTERSKQGTKSKTKSQAQNYTVLPKPICITAF